MKPSILVTCVLVALLASCTSIHTNPAEEKAFAKVRTVLETNCVHCHGDNRLSTMPPINDTQALSKLIGSHWIVPGKPEASRFFQVVTFPDEIPGAMPPSGHAISKQDVQTLRDWIKHGAKVPVHNVKLVPQGPLPRSI
ncbi:MAG: c-type cytochrome [Prosthecobacter sp.]|uniref:c-type cytochrome n=1 Tax=Prosthecobacter sp. TaxID=1965333 RepID=UPI0025D1A129|nr:c-type cytochrome [Prosthecobacter sp.]MCF7786055.1 c-type cytochrome [Prosthecobacter sp.]